jgi:hypothetical protein
LTSVPVVASVLVTTRSLELPAASAGVTAVSEVLEPMTMDVAGAPPIVTRAPSSKSVPATVMAAAGGIAGGGEDREKGSRARTPRCCRRDPSRWR